MKKSLLLALILVLIAPFAMNAQNGSKDMWDFVTSFSCSTGRQHAVVYDGEYIYTAAWGKSSSVLYMFYKYDMEGTLLDQFDVPGVTNSDNYVRDLTYDGTYFYGCDAHSGTIWCYDLHNKTLVSANNIVTNFSELGTCTYDPVYDAFWVGERATGSSPSLHLDLKLVNRSGTVIKTASAHNLGGHTVHGTGYFTDEEGVAHLYLFAVEGFTAHVFDYLIEADSMSSNYIFDFSVTPGWGAACSAGGAYVGVREGVQYFFGDVDISEVPLFPENYLVTPYKLDCEQVMFRACVQDITHPAEHLGVAVSTTEANSADDFTIIWDVDMTAKDAGNWYQFNVDLREYQGQDIYVAIVHYNCTDQFMVNVDDILLNRQFDNVAENAFNAVSVYPNPASEKILVDSQVVVNQYTIYNVAGEMILSNQVGEKSFEVNVNELPAGAYIIKLISEGCTESRRFLKK